MYKIYCILWYLKVLHFAIFAIFDRFREILYPRKVSKLQIVKLNTRKVKNLPSLRFFFSYIWSNYDIDNRTSHASTYTNKLTYLPTITLAIEKLIFDETFVSYFYWHCKIRLPGYVLQSPNREIKYLIGEKKTGKKWLILDFSD